jgi:magnesium transporter
MFLPMSFLAGFFGMNFFGETLAFKSALPKAFLFTTSCLIMFLTPFGMYLWARRRRWF